MPPGLSFVILSPTREFDVALESSVHVEILAHVEQFEDLVRTVELEHPDALLIALGDNPEAAFATLEKLPNPRPLLFFCGPDDSQAILQAMRMGAREYIAPAPDEKDQLLAAVERAARESSGSATLQPAPLIAVTGAKGGVGTSFVACQLAASLAKFGGRTALVDGQLRRGDVSLYFDLTPHFSFASLANRSEAIDPTFLETILVGHSSGVQVLAAPKYPEEARLTKWDGQVLIQAVITKDGDVRRIKVLHCDQPDMGFEEAAILAVGQWRFEPATRDGEPVDVYFTFVISFKPE